MHKLRILSLAVTVILINFASGAYGQVNGQTNLTGVHYAEIPAKTLFIKHPAANDPATFFSTNTNFSLDIYKPGDMDKIIAALKKDPQVQSCSKGTLTGDYQQFNLTVKSTKNKMWFISLFKKAGISTVKINNNNIVEIERM